MNADQLETILNKQRDYFVDVLGANRQWMQEQLAKQAEEYGKLQLSKAAQSPANSDLTSQNRHVPAFTPFIKEKSNWDIYIAQMQQHFEAYKVDNNEQKRAFFLSWIGQECFELLTKLYGSENIQSKTFDELIAKLSSHFKSGIHVLASRYELFTLKMKQNQSYAEWIAELRGIARNCKYISSKSGCNTEFVEELIRDIVVLNTPHEVVRTAALQKINPTLDDIVLIAESYETTQALKKKMSAEKTTNEVFQLKRKQSKSRKNNDNAAKTKSDGKLQSCSGCGTHHPREKCKFRNAQCRLCKRYGHIAPVCKTNAAPDAKNQGLNC